MSAIITQLGLDKSQFARSAKEAEGDLKRFEGQVKETAAAVAAFERTLKSAGGGSDAQRAQLKALQLEHKNLQREIKATEAQQRALTGAAGTGAAPTPGGLNEHSKGQMLAHSSRAMLDMMLAGQSPINAAAIEAPRTMQAFGGGLGPMIAAGALFALGQKLHEIYTEAQKLREELDKLSEPVGSKKGSKVSDLLAQLTEVGKRSLKSRKRKRRSPASLATRWAGCVRRQRKRAACHSRSRDSTPTPSSKRSTRKSRRRSICANSFTKK